MNKIDEYLSEYQDLKIIHRAYKKSPLRKTFDNIKEEEANLIDKIATTKDIELYQAIYHYLAWNGYLSADGHFIATSKTSKELTMDFAIAVACGNGCCRNFAPHFKSIVELLDSSARLILVGTKYHYKKEPLPSNEKIKYKADKESLQHKRKPIIIDWNTPNHVEILDISSKTPPKILDPFNFDIQTILKTDDSILKSKVVDFGLGILLDLDMNEKVREYLLENALILEKVISRRKLEEKQLQQKQELLEEAASLCESRQALLNQHKEKMGKAYQYIKKETTILHSKGY